MPRPVVDMQIAGPVQPVREACECILRSLPEWFGIESALIEYADDTQRWPTFVALHDGETVGFMTLKSHSQSECEIHCMAVHQAFRGQGMGAALVRAGEAWMKAHGAHRLIVKTLDASHPSPAYKASRAFYLSQGFVAERIIPDIWGPFNPCLQMHKTV